MINLNTIKKHLELEREIPTSNCSVDYLSQVRMDMEELILEIERLRDHEWGHNLRADIVRSHITLTCNSLATHEYIAQDLREGLAQALVEEDKTQLTGRLPDG